MTSLPSRRDQSDTNPAMTPTRKSLSGSDLSPALGRSAIGIS
jgi:hypothetical protein